MRKIRSTGKAPNLRSETTLAEGVDAEDDFALVLRDGISAALSVLRLEVV